MDLVYQVLPEQSAKLLEEKVRQLSSERTHRLLTFRLIFTVWSASAGVYATIEQLNRVYGVKDRRGSDFFPMRILRGVSLLQPFVDRDAAE